MADLGFEFDPADVPPSEYNNEPVPQGQYRLMVTDSEVVDTKNGQGKLLKLKNEIDGGPYHGRIVWDQLNIVNASAQAQSIGRQQMASLFEACGVGRGNDSSVLHFKPYLADVRIEAKDGYDPRNIIKKYRPLGAGAAAPQAATRPAAARPAPAAQSRPAALARPWGKWQKPGGTRAREPEMADDDIPF